MKGVNMVDTKKNIIVLTKFIFITVLIICSTKAQNGRILQLPSYENGHGWDIRLAVPGRPGNDYPTLSSIPRTRFTCAGKDPGYYADVDTNCQVFRVCTVGATYGFQSFLCPNGTLFNQAVFVCDWWMNVICNKSDELIRNRNEQFDNLKLGPQLMKDIKKMLTHPVRNPVNTNSMKSKVIVMQNYKPPSGQLFPNGALLTPPERPPSHIYFPTKAIQTALRNNDYRIASLAYSASTPNPQYIPPIFSTFTPTTVRNVEILQRLNERKTQTQNNNNPNILQPETGISNGHAGQIPPQSRYSNVENNFINNQATRQLQKYNDLRNLHRTQNTNNFNGIKGRSGQKDSQIVRYFENFDEQIRDGNRGSTDKINTSNEFKQQQALSVTTESPTVLTSSTQKSYNGIFNQVSSDIVPPTILSKTVAYSRLVKEPTQGSPKSRITFKTWVLKPSKNAKLIANPTSYTYDQPNKAQVEESELKAPYNYNKPIESVTADINLQPELEGYNYPDPTTPLFENINEPQVSRLYLTPTTLQPAFNEVSLTTATTEPLETSLSLDPVSPKSSARKYLPPTITSSTISNQYLQPISTINKLSRYQNVQFIANPTESSIDYITSYNKNDFNPLINVKTHVDDSYSNLSFSDILSKEKLDITINEIVNDTNDIIQTASPESFGQYVEDFQTKTSNRIISKNNSAEEELPQPHISRVSKPAKLIAIPSTELELPKESFKKHQSVNKISNLPFLQETSLPTIERTVSLKITIPESIANYLFKTHQDAELEILNTDSSNYLILNNTHDKNSHSQFTPIGKLRWDGNSSLSSSQALVFSLVVDSINAAKKYKNIIQDNLISPIPSGQKQFQAVNSEELGQISNTISKLTASQYTNKNFKQSNNINAKIYQPSNEYVSNQNKITEAYISHSKQHQSSLEHAREKESNLVSQSSEDNLYSKHSTNPTSNLNTMPQGNTDKIYSGQFYKFPVPEVTRQIINSPNPANSNIVINSSFDKVKSQHTVIPKNSLKTTSSSNSYIDSKSIKKDFKTKSFQSARLQVTSSTEFPQSYAKHSNVFVSDILNLGSGITAQIQDKIAGAVLHPSDSNKFVTYKKDQSYNLYSKILNKDNIATNIHNQQKKEKQMQSNNYPDLITFHFIPSDDQNRNNNNVMQEELQNYRLSERNNFNDNNDGIEITNNQIYDLSSPNDVTTHDTRNVVDSDLTKQRQSINTLYEGPSSYSAPQSSIGNLILTQGTPNYNERIEDLDENSNFNGYLKERPSRQFNF